jgi:hypothetical protein
MEVRVHNNPALYDVPLGYPITSLPILSVDDGAQCQDDFAVSLNAFFKPTIDSDGHSSSPPFPSDAAEGISHRARPFSCFSATTTISVLS